MRYDIVGTALENMEISAAHGLLTFGKKYDISAHSIPFNAFGLSIALSAARQPLRSPLSQLRVLCGCPEKNDSGHEMSGSD